MKDSLHDRMRQLVGQRTFAQIALDTGTNPETTRRYFRTGRPSVAFVIALCREYNASANWLLLGYGPRYQRHDPNLVVQEALNQCSMTELFDELKRRVRDMSFVTVDRYQMRADPLLEVPSHSS